MSVSASANSASDSKQGNRDMAPLNQNVNLEMQTRLDVQSAALKPQDQSPRVRPKLPPITTSTPRGEALASTPTFLRYTNGCSPRLHRAGADLPLELRQYAAHFRDQVWIGPDAPELTLDHKFTIEPDLDPRTGKSPQKRERSDSIQSTPIECYPSSDASKVWWVRFSKVPKESNPRKVMRRPTKYVHAASHEQDNADSDSDDAAESDKSSLKTTASGETGSTGKRSSGSSDSSFKGSRASPARLGYEDPVLHLELLADQAFGTEPSLAAPRVFGSSRPDLRPAPPSPVLTQPGHACYCAQGRNCKNPYHSVTNMSPERHDRGKTKDAHWYSGVLGPLKVANP